MFACAEKIPDGETCYEDKRYDGERETPEILEEHAIHAEPEKRSESEKEPVSCQSNAFECGGKRVIDHEGDTERSGQCDRDGDGDGFDKLSDKTGREEKRQECPHGGECCGGEHDFEIAQDKEHCFFWCEFSGPEVLLGCRDDDDSVVNQESHGEEQ